MARQAYVRGAFIVKPFRRMMRSRMLLKRKRNRETWPARQAQHKFATIVDAVLLSLSHDTGKAMKAHSVPGDIRPSP